MNSKQTLWKQIKEDFMMPYRCDPAINSKWEIFFNYPGVWAVANYRIANRMYNSGWKLAGRILMGISQIFTGIDIHPGCEIGRRFFIDHGLGVVVGETTKIGNDVLLYQQVTLGGVSLDRNIKRHPTLEDGVVVGGGAKVLGNITIGKNSKIGANSVIIHDVPAESTAVGIPAKVIQKGRDKSQHSHNKLPDINKELFEYIIKRLNVLEEAMAEHDESIVIEKDKELEKIYQAFINALK